jgi:hypothetical protein
LLVQVTSCDVSGILGRYVNNATEVLVGSSCAPVTALSDQVSAMFTSLQNNTLYRLSVVLTDTNNNQVGRGLASCFLQGAVPCAPLGCGRGL